MRIQNNDITPATSQNYIRHPITNKLYSLNTLRTGEADLRY